MADKEWECQDCDNVMTNESSPESCPECGSSNIQELNWEDEEGFELDEELVDEDEEETSEKETESEDVEGWDEDSKENL